MDKEDLVATHPMLHAVELHRVMRRSMREKTHDSGWWLITRDHYNSTLKQVTLRGIDLQQPPHRTATDSHLT